MADTQIKERPILFSAPMVRALLDGRKTQTRRLVKKWFFAKGYEGLNLDFSGLVPTKAAPDFWHLSSRGEGGCWNERAAAVCPHGTIGDRLWVRETWRPVMQTAGHAGDLDIRYSADDVWRYISTYDYPDTWNYPAAAYKGNASPLFMPRWASRITLEINDVRVERLQDISLSDAIAEGIDPVAKDVTYDCEGDDVRLAQVYMRQTYFNLWNSIHGENASAANPWVWAVSFRRLEAL